jgi:hypothetical protein
MASMSVVTTRFNKSTWEENIQFRKKYNHACIYPVPKMNSEQIDPYALLFVVEMNNETNCIEGIGLVRNRCDYKKRYIVYDDNNYNRFCYIGNYHIFRETLVSYHPRLVFILDQICFKGKTHLKRGIGMTSITEKLLRDEICQGLHIKDEIKGVFQRHFSKIWQQEEKEEKERGEKEKERGEKEKERE